MTEHCAASGDFSRVFKYFCHMHLATRRQEGAALAAPGKMLAGMRLASALGERALPCAFGEPARAVIGLQSVLLLWSGEARDFSNSLLLPGSSAAVRGSPHVT